MPRNSKYEVFARYAKAGTATNAKYTIEHDAGVETRTVDQTQQAGQWVSLGSFGYTEDAVKKITLSDNADGTVVADAVKLVRDAGGEADKGDAKATYGYTAYGKNDDKAFAGVDKPDPQNPAKDLYNPYRFNAKRFDQATGDYIKVAKAEAADLRDALNTADRTGNVVNEIKAEETLQDDPAGWHRQARGRRHHRHRVHLRPQWQAEHGEGPKFVARGVVTLDFLQYGADIYDKGWKEATFDLLDVTGIGREYLEMQQMCAMGGCVA